MDTLLGTPMVPGTFNAALDAKMFDVQKPFKRFYRVAKYARAKSVIWRSCADAINGPNGGFNILPNCQTTLYAPTTGLGPGDHIGDIRATWYIRFNYRTRV